MYHIKEVEIKGFWGKDILKTNLHPNANIFIGKNGTGKTTFINILQSILTVDLDLMKKHQFSEVIIKLFSKNKPISIIVNRKREKRSYDILEYQISDKTYTIPLYPHPEDIIEYRGRISRRYYSDISLKEYKSLKKKMDALFNISWISVQRERIEELEKDTYLSESIFEEDPVDQRLKILMNKFMGYQLFLKGKASERANKFQKDVLLSTLYDKKLDSLIGPLDISFGAVPEEEEQKLIHAFQELGIKGKAVEKKINNHIKVLTLSKKKINAMLQEKKGIDIKHFLPVPLIQRTEYIINLSKDAEFEKKIIFEPIEQFLDMLQRFTLDKKFSLNPDGELKIKKGRKKISLEELSSGEKQLLIFLIETLLQKNEPFIFIADEPELSLHIEWQEKLISSIMKLNENAQIIVATHAPSIAAQHRNNVINMENIFVR